MSVKVYGKGSDGSLSVCKATPEFRGVGNCHHEEHVEFDVATAEDDVMKHNEKVFAESLGEFPAKIIDNKYPTAVTDNQIQSHKGGKTLSKDELLEASKKVAESFEKEDWKMIQDFYKNFNRRITDRKMQNRFEGVTENIETFLKSSNDTAKQVREFLGDKVNLHEFSHIITHQVKAMTVAEKWSSKRRSGIKRILFTSLNNDMTRERYVASVMFFGGRCCYCNRVLRKNPPPENRASGEHLTAVSPDDPNAIHGGTRYGNMVLACVKCNSSRRNKDLVEWVQETDCIQEEDKAHVLGRIQAFRKFALYEEYDKEENDRILETSEKLADYVNTFRDKSGKIADSAHDKIAEKIKVALYDLRYGEGEND